MEFFNFNINIKLRLLCGFVTRVFNMAVTPFMAIYFSQLLSPIIAGIILSIGIVLNILFNLVGGYLADIFNNKKILVIGITLNGLSLIIIGVSMFFNHYGIYFTILFFLINSIFSVIYKASLSAMIIDVTNENNRKKVFSYNYWLVNLSVAMGVSIGGIYFKDYSNFIYLIAGISTIIIGLVYNFYMINYDSKSYNDSPEFSLKVMINTYRYAAKDIYYVIFILSGAIIFSSEWHLTNLISINLVSSNITNNIGSISLNPINTIASLQVINTIIIIVFSISISKVIENFKIKNTLAIGMFLYSLSYIIMIMNNNIIILAILIVIASFGELIFAPSYQVAQVEMMNLERKGSYSALGSLATQSSSLIASLILMVSGYLNNIIISIFLCLISLLAIFTINNSYKVKRKL